MKPTKLIKALFTRRKKDAVGSYINNIQTIYKLIDSDLLYIDIKKPYVALSLRLHMAFMDDEYKLNTFKYRLLAKIGLVERDARYKSLMQNILAYINYNRGRQGLSVYAPDKRLDFLVMNLENTKPLLVGVFQNGKVDYQSMSEPTP